MSICRRTPSRSIIIGMLSSCVIGAVMPDLFVRPIGAMAATSIFSGIFCRMNYVKSKRQSLIVSPMAQMTMLKLNGRASASWYWKQTVGSIFKNFSTTWPSSHINSLVYWASTTMRKPITLKEANKLTYQICATHWVLHQLGLPCSIWCDLKLLWQHCCNIHEWFGW